MRLFVERGMTGYAAAYAFGALSGLGVAFLVMVGC